jgi:hypothetical protein
MNVIAAIALACIIVFVLTTNPTAMDTIKGAVDSVTNCISGECNSEEAVSGITSDVQQPVSLPFWLLIILGAILLLA